MLQDIAKVHRYAQSAPGFPAVTLISRIAVQMKPPLNGIDNVLKCIYIQWTEIINKKGV